MSRADVEVLGEGREVVLLHSLLSDRAGFADLANRLGAKRRLIIPDLPGFGAATPAEPLDGYADRIAALLMELGVAPAADVIGNGLGSFVALKLAARNPSAVGRLVLLGAAIAFPEAGRQTFRTLAEKVERDGMDAVADAAMARMFPEDFIAASPQIVGERRTAFRAIKPDTFAAAARALAALDLTSELALIQNPVLVVAGEKDGATPPALGRALAERLPNARMTELPGIGHAPHIQSPDTLIRVIAPFLGLR